MHPSRARSLTILALAVFATAATAQHRHAHVHGVVALEAALDGGTLDVTLRAPLDSLLGFERPPRSDAEKRAAQALQTRLGTDPAMLRPDPAAACTPAGVELISAALGLGTAPPDADGHAELEARWRFSCTAPDKLGHLDLGFVGTYRGIGRVEATTVGAKGQHKAVLRRPAQRLAWPR